MKYAAESVALSPAMPVGEVGLKANIDKRCMTSLSQQSTACEDDDAVLEAAAKVAARRKCDDVNDGLDGLGLDVDQGDDEEEVEFHDRKVHEDDEGHEAACEERMKPSGAAGRYGTCRSEQLDFSYARALPMRLADMTVRHREKCPNSLLCSSMKSQSS